MASTLPQAREQKSFGSFLQKRTASFPTYHANFGWSVAGREYFPAY
jgi:hypothetical protein